MKLTFMGAGSTVFSKNVIGDTMLCEAFHDIKNDTPQKCIDRLKQWEENPNCPCEIELYYDSAPHSFGFRQVYPDGRTGIVGGLLYHGNPDQSFAVLLNPMHGWSIHT